MNSQVEIFTETYLVVFGNKVSILNSIVQFKKKCYWDDVVEKLETEKLIIIY